MARVRGIEDDVLHTGEGGIERSAWLEIDWRVHARWERVEEDWANVVVLGEGPPLLFVHGLGGCWQNWLEQLPAFAAAHRVIAVDLPGFGASPMPQRELSMGAYARFLDRLCERLGVVEPLTVVGNSMGGAVAAELALQAPQRVERLVLVSSAGLSSEIAKREPVLAAARTLAAVTRWGAARHEAFARRPGLRRVALGYVVRRPQRLPAPLAFELMEGSGRDGFLPALEALLRYPLRARLGEIACPTLIVWGEDDRIVPVKDAGRFEERIPDAHVVVLPDTGHLPMVERPQVFNGLLRGFLARP